MAKKPGKSIQTVTCHTTLAGFVLISTLPQKEYRFRTPARVRKLKPGTNYFFEFDRVVNTIKHLSSKDCAVFGINLKHCK